METVFLKILNMSITAGWLVLVVLLMRLLLKKAPRYLTVIMWALVGVRLVLPFSLESALSLIPSTETVPPEILYDRSPEIQTGIDVLNSAVNPVISESFAPDPLVSVNPLQILTLLAGWLWLAGIVGMAVYALISYLRIHRRVREAAPLQGNVWLCDRIDTPFILGLFRPRIYLPSAMAAEDIPYVLAHEQAHLKRKDHLWKPLGFLLLSIHWFNPLLWVAYILLCRDIEVACDEKVLKAMGEEAKKPYSLALINCSVPRRTVAACPLAFGEVSVKSRIKKVLNYKKPAFWLLIAAIVVCLILSVCFLTNPRTVGEQMQIFLDCQIAEHFQTDKSAGNACCLDYQILGTKKSGKTTTVYMWVLYEEYSYKNGQLQEETGAHIPTVVTATKEDSSYQLVEYWEPRDGSYYGEDIQAKFPWYLRGKALDSQRYIDRQQAACLEMAEQYFKENPPGLDSTPIIEAPGSLQEILDYARGLIDSTLFDIDGDGKPERCELHYGPTSGIFTFILAVYENETLEYCSCYTDEHGDVSFAQQADGTIGIHYASPTDATASGFYELKIVDGNIQLFRDGSKLTSSNDQLQDDLNHFKDALEDKQKEYELLVLKQKYPQYFDLPAGKGLVVYVWQMAHGSYSWGLLPGRNMGYTQSELLELKSASLEEICIIVASYGLDSSQISVHPIRMIYSSYYYEIDDAYLASVEKMFWDAYSSMVKPSTTCQRIELSFYGNASNALTIDDPTICSYLLQLVSQAYSGAIQGESTKGYYGVPYYLKLYLNTQTEPWEIALWDTDTFSTLDHCDSEGYPYFYKADLSQLYAYLARNYPVASDDPTFYYPVPGGTNVNDIFDINLSHVGMVDTNPLYSGALNWGKMAISSVRHLPIFKCDTAEDLEQFKRNYIGASSDAGWDEVPSFNAVTAQYDDAFFAENSLLLVYVQCGNCTYRFGVNSIYHDGTSLCVHVEETTGAKEVADAEADWFITVAVPDSMVANCAQFDADLGNFEN